MSDESILELANNESDLLITCDKDFGELVFRSHRLSKGIILLRFAGLSNDRKAEIVSKVIGEIGSNLKKAFTVITPGLIRIRHQIN